MKKKGKQEVLLFVLIILLPARLWSRLVEPPSMADEQWLARRVDTIFKGTVIAVTPDPRGDPHYWAKLDGKPMNDNFDAKFRIERVYRGNIADGASVHFVWGIQEIFGHDCIDFKPGQHWVVFAENKGGELTLADDCDGALAVSPRLGQKLEGAGWSKQMEADFIAGLGDSDPADRILSLQRLGGLKLASSRPAIHREIEQSQGEEKKWAVYAALRTGDVTVLPLVKDYVTSAGKKGVPEEAMLVEFRWIKDPAAVPGLLDILANAPNDDTRQMVLIPLVDNVGDPRAIPALGESLSSSNGHILYLAVTGLGKIAHAEACKISGAGDDEMLFRQQVAACKTWWEKTGSKQDWSTN